MMVTMAEVTLGSAGGTTGELTPPGAAGGIAGGSELTPPGPAGDIAGGKTTTPGSGGGSGNELTPGSAGGSATTTAGVATLLQQELSLLDLGSNCSVDCMRCIFFTIVPCFADGIICLDPLVVAMCFIENIDLVENCFGTGEGSASGERKLTTPGSAGGPASELMPGLAGASATTALPRQELGLLDDIGRNCSNDCKDCLLNSIGSCAIGGIICGTPWGVFTCLIQRFSIIVGCFGTKPT
ncbi:hypothetical protein SETIT_7G003800v2 [Setaria italica]|uniref:Uncharacterized protein n=1 Tax=Setaria italica TaxID=4555 RepID=A0A368RQI1_SETIT|nr:hypothetical protein SETIT_7G003800v2 [Setaria italica]